MKVVSIKSISIMSRESVKRINKAWKAFLFIAAAAMAVCAWIWNPCHLFTAGLILACAFESEIVKSEDYDIC